MVTVSAAVTVLVLTLFNTTDGRSELEANLELLPLTTLEEVASSKFDNNLIRAPKEQQRSRNWSWTWTKRAKDGVLRCQELVQCVGLGMSRALQKQNAIPSMNQSIKMIQLCFHSKINILHITIVYRKAARVSFQHEIPAHPISRLPTKTSGGSFRASITGSVFMLAVASALL